MKNNLITRREQLNLSQKDIAAIIGVLPQAYQRYEYGTREPGVSTALRIAKALKCTVEDLFVLDEED